MIHCLVSVSKDFLCQRSKRYKGKSRFFWPSAKWKDSEGWRVGGHQKLAIGTNPFLMFYIATNWVTWKMMAVEIGDRNFKHCKFWLSIFKLQRLDKRLEKLGPVEHFIILSAPSGNFQLACQQNEHFGWTTPAAWWELACEITAVIFWKPLVDVYA